MRRRPLVYVGIAVTVDLPLERAFFSREQLRGVVLLPVDLDDDFDLDLVLVVHGIALRLKAARQLDRLLDGLRVVVLHRAPVDVEDARVELRVNDAEVPERGSFMLALLAVVETDDEITVNVLHLSHGSAAPS